VDRKESLETKIWVTNDGRHLALHEIDDNHLKNLVRFIERHLTEADMEVRSLHDLEDYKDDPTLLIQACDEQTYWSEWLKLVKGEQRRRRSDASAQS
jgi:hypothetical protein